LKNSHGVKLLLDDCLLGLLNGFARGDSILPQPCRDAAEPAKAHHHARKDDSPGRNGDGIEFPGLTYGNDVLDELLRELGVIFTRASLHNPNATPSGKKEYDLSGRWTWGHDRVM
jgi:hypothetical protein